MDGIHGRVRATGARDYGFSRFNAMRVKEHSILNATNCLRTVGADRVSFLIDGDAYFSTLFKTLMNASRSIFIAGWDVDSRSSLLNDTEEQRSSSRLGDFLNRIVSQKQNLHAYVLAWDFAMIYALERELLPTFKLGWLTHKRVHFRTDNQHPITGSHHQKIVVVDEKIAFTGGLDLAINRWDTAEHRASDPRRVDPDGNSYLPFHDVQAAVDGEAALCLGEVFRNRWLRATGEQIPTTEPGTPDPWPEDLEPDLHDVTVGIARTMPAFRGHPEVREVEALHLDAIASARTSIYIETQYLTSRTIGTALMERLRRKDGPEVAIVLPMRSSGWLEEQTMDALRKRLLLDLKESDHHGRLGVFFPINGEDEEIPIYVHAKILIVDNRFVTIGSSNLNNRSMGLDSECNLGIEAGEDIKAREAIASLRDRLLAHYMGVSPETVSGAMEENGSLIKTIERLRNPSRGLEPFSDELLKEQNALELDGSLIDPERPVDPDRLLDEFVPEEMRSSGVTRLTRIALLVLLMGGIAAAWRWTPLGDYLSMENLIEWGSTVREHPASLVIVLAAYGIGGLIAFPITVLISATAFVFQPFTAAFYSLAGSLLSGTILYGIGHFLGRRGVRRIAGKRLNRISRILAKRGLLTIFLARIFPVAPYSIINVVAGASHIRFRDYLIGTALGVTPGIVMVTFFAGEVRSIIQDPKPESYLIALALVLAGAAIILLSHKFIKKRFEKTQPY
jgi:phosphatidylserine/phosphatidylglycerophosphate/cardiolipin synthase-like enzyme/uncharacterized membrane protein YdjX (TVP38/TMEM64 family)